jgi:LAO/AO transport system kinase
MSVSTRKVSATDAGRPRSTRTLRRSAPASGNATAEADDVLAGFGDAGGLAGAVRAGNRRALARAITVVESHRPDHRRLGEALLRTLLPDTGRSVRLGISGVPGVGKSTFIEALGLHVIAGGHQVAVLAVDPSSPRTGGSILGDKTRMQELSRRTDAFIRPSPTGGTLGGVARRSREAMLVCEAAGFDVIFVETVGVGQSETAVADLVDMFVLLLAPGTGDDLQGIKKGIVELADLIVVNKADGDLEMAAERARRDYTSALRMLRPASPHWTVPVLQCSALLGTGIAEVWETVERYRDTPELAAGTSARRQAQARAWMWNEVNEALRARIRTDPRASAAAETLEARVTAGEITPTEAARVILGEFLGT